MIKAFKAGFLKFDNEENKRKGHYLVLEMTIKNMPSIQLIVISNDGLVTARTVDTVTEITGFHRYMPKHGAAFGAGELTPLNTKDDNGMLEGLAKQLGFDYNNLAIAFGRGLLETTET